MRHLSYALLSLSAFILGGLLVSYQNGWIILRYPSVAYDITQQKALHTVRKKNITFHWYNAGWHQEQTELLWSDSLEQNIHYVINSWLTFLDEESLMKKKITVQAVVTTGHPQEISVSFDRNPLSKEHATFTKLMWIEGLLKTLRENDMPIQRIRFLSRHQELLDPHLDFSNPWPITGFLPT